jgi:hypothetical protein
MLDAFLPILQSAVKAGVAGSRRVRVVFFIGGLLLAAATVLGAIGSAVKLQSSWYQAVAITLAIIGGISVLGVGVYEQAQASSAREQVIKEVEERARTHPKEPQAAWDLARVKLESYLNRNLRQIQWIFFLTLLVMIVGFVIIGYGIIRVYQSPENFRPSIVVTLSGVVVEFIGATFLLIYRSTMEQAQTYVSMLEKINAVGMSINILDTMTSANTDKVRAQLAMELLSLYGTKKVVRSSERKSSSK